ncbi:unnamed protein product [Symbiodinium natans]|uniref:Uncharacterized protein n=1 Tax=Symbiodinium natans TaxID=878477 RepID=A0A812SUE4_9DINO|nr:unnamed protein product [Symbiodinium natans]
MHFGGAPHVAESLHFVVCYQYLPVKTRHPTTAQASRSSCLEDSDGGRLWDNIWACFRLHPREDRVAAAWRSASAPVADRHPATAGPRPVLHPAPAKSALSHL